MTYQYPGEDHFGYRFQNDRWWRINIGSGPDGDRRANSTSPAWPLDRIEKIVDCSTREYVCAQTYLWVLAVPKANLKSGVSYDIAGAHIQLSTCVRQTTDSCAAIVAVTDCRSRNSRTPRAVGEIVRNDCRASGWGERVVFIYDRARGVIAFEETDDWIPEEDSRKWDLSSLGKTAAMLALQEPEGLLSCDLPRAKP